MRWTIAVTSLLPILLLASPASALTTKEKMETCKFGADDQKLTGAKRNAFIKRCMANEPRKKTVAKKPAPKTAPNTAPNTAPMPANSAPPPKPQ
jgi:psiF repeat